MSLSVDELCAEIDRTLANSPAEFPEARKLSEETKAALRPSAGSAIYGILLTIQQDNCASMVPDPNGPYPSCKPSLGGHRCERCGRYVEGRSDACPAVPREQRWRFMSPNAQGSPTANLKGDHEAKP